MNHTNYQSSVLRSLRALMPARVLTYAELLQRAELQAGRLLDLHSITRGPVPTEIVGEMPRFRIERDWNMPTSGSAVWDGGAWVLTLNAGEHETRQRFSLMHEFKHVIDHPVRHLITGTRSLTADQVAERVADYFAACVLMPRAWVKAAWCSGTQRIELLAALFDVSPRAMSIRLDQLGLLEPARRCRPVQGLSLSSRPRYARYYRPRTPTTGVAS